MRIRTSRLRTAHAPASARPRRAPHVTHVSQRGPNRTPRLKGGLYNPTIYMAPLAGWWCCFSPSSTRSASLAAHLAPLRPSSRDFVNRSDCRDGSRVPLRCLRSPQHVTCGHLPWPLALATCPGHKPRARTRNHTIWRPAPLPRAATAASPFRT